MNRMTRLNKFLSECGVASRRKSDELIEQGRVTVNGKTIIEFGFQVNESEDDVKVDGERIHHRNKVYFILNKPKGTVTTTDDEKGRRTVVDLIKTNEKIFPVGRLDYNTTGLLLLTNDGEFANHLMHPRNKITREYQVKLDKDLGREDKIKLERGIILERRRSRFTSIQFTDTKNFRSVTVTTVEGRNHFVKRMFHALGYFVKELNRNSYGPFKLKELPVGSYVKLDEKEISKVYDKKK